MNNLSRYRSTQSNSNPNSEASESGEINFGFKKVKYDEKQRKVNEVFNNVAEKYDLMNDAMSFGNFFKKCHGQSNLTKKI